METSAPGSFCMCLFFFPFYITVRQIISFCMQYCWLPSPPPRPPPPPFQISWCEWSSLSWDDSRAVMGHRGACISHVFLEQRCVLIVLLFTVPDELPYHRGDKCAGHEGADPRHECEWPCWRSLWQHGEMDEVAEKCYHTPFPPNKNVWNSVGGEAEGWRCYA